MQRLLLIKKLTLMLMLMRLGFVRFRFRADRAEQWSHNLKKILTEATYFEPGEFVLMSKPSHQYQYYQVKNS